eukprot:TRINITY_DN22223_c0_g1_i1.p2 TRINITY_DN22223_c0_g1~~TRINITY_DN22223_c0_g1_i1.p2  ORF type:complete len:214 (+),score=72.92 TRINITY_DN22223_c0_g1_i1:49-642(+)
MPVATRLRLPVTARDALLAVRLPRTRRQPHVTHTAVMSADGRTACADEHVSTVALSARPCGEPGAEADRRLLQAGWVVADAVLGSGAVLRAEPLVLWAPVDEDLRRARRRRRRRGALCVGWAPLQCVVTQNGCISPQHPILSDGSVNAVVLAPPAGAAEVARRCGVAPPPPGGVCTLQQCGSGRKLLRTVEASQSGC